MTATYMTKKEMKRVIAWLDLFFKMPFGQEIKILNPCNYAVPWFEGELKDMSLYTFYRIVTNANFFTQIKAEGDCLIIEAWNND